jgi:hypothetical protein
MTRTITMILMATAAAVLVGWDLYVAVCPPPGDTISELLSSWAYRWPTLPFAFGVVGGHLFCPSTFQWERKARAFFLALIAVGLLILDVGGLAMRSTAPFLFGVLAGNLLWPMPPRGQA